MWLPRGGREWGRTLPSHGYQWKEASGTSLILSWRQRAKWLALFPEDSRRGDAHEMDSGSPFWNLKWGSFRYCNSVLLGGGWWGSGFWGRNSGPQAWKIIHTLPLSYIPHPGLLMNVCPSSRNCCSEPTLGWGRASLSLFSPPWSCLCSCLNWLVGLDSFIYLSAHLSVHLFSWTPSMDGDSPGLPLLYFLCESVWNSQAMPQNLLWGTGLGRPLTPEEQEGVDSN